MSLFGGLYDRVLGWSRHRHAERYLGALSFAESSFFPIPPDVMLAPMVLAAPRTAWRLAFITTLTSVLGGLAGYLIGSLALDAVYPLLERGHYLEHFDTAQAWFKTYGFWAVFVAGFSPVPYKIFTISAGAAAMPLAPFVLASVIGRGARFFLLAGLLRAAGEPFEQALRRNVDRVALAGVLVIALALWWLKH